MMHLGIKTCAYVSVGGYLKGFHLSDSTKQLVSKKINRDRLIARNIEITNLIDLTPLLKNDDHHFRIELKTDKAAITHYDFFLPDYGIPGLSFDEVIKLAMDV